jgi:4-hydroxybutyrate CoA-transferase
MSNLNIGIVYCGGCNPHFDRIVFVDSLIKRTAGKMCIENANHSQPYDVILAICGCSCACANVKDFEAGRLVFITPREINKPGFEQDLIDSLKKG